MTHVWHTKPKQFDMTYILMSQYFQWKNKQISSFWVIILPVTPQSWFTKRESHISFPVSLQGGEKSLLQDPKHCTLTNGHRSYFMLDSLPFDTYFFHIDSYTKLHFFFHLIKFLLLSQPQLYLAQMCYEYNSQCFHTGYFHHSPLLLPIPTLSKIA